MGTISITGLIVTALLSMVPTFEGRYAVITAIGLGMNVVPAYILAFVCSSIPVPLIMLLLRRVLDWLYKLPIGFLRKFASLVERKGVHGREKMQKTKGGRLSKFLRADMLEMTALCIFVAIPFPGTGAWTGAMVATLFDLPKKKSIAAILIGNAIACLITTLTTVAAMAVAG